MTYPKFHYNRLDQLFAALTGEPVPFAQMAEVLASPLRVGKYTVPNRIAYQPMEGCDGTVDGCPDEFTFRRYRRFAEGGPGLIWLEACAVRPEARANPRQLWLHDQNADSFKALIEDIREVAFKKNGYVPVLILQLTHSGRYSKPNGVPEPLVMYNNPLFENSNPLSALRVVSDDYLMELEQDFGIAAGLAEKIGVDGVDIKACHGYLLSEALSAYTRPGLYGGSFENRTRLLLNSMKAAKAAMSSKLIVTSRLNFYDGFPHPYGFGMLSGGSLAPDAAEPLDLVRMLAGLGVPLLNITAGNPYVNAYINRPADIPVNLGTQNPLAGVARLFDCARQAQAGSGVQIIATGLSYLRQYGGLAGAGLIEQGWAAMAGFGRMTLAYPEMARDLLTAGELKPEKCCVACGKCSELMRGGFTPGCVVRDGLYTKLYNEMRKK